MIHYVFDLDDTIIIHNNKPIHYKNITQNIHSKQENFIYRLYHNENFAIINCRYVIHR